MLRSCTADTTRRTSGNDMQRRGRLGTGTVGRQAFTMRDAQTARRSKKDVVRSWAAQPSARAPAWERSASPKPEDEGMRPEGVLMRQGAQGAGREGDSQIRKVPL